MITNDVETTSILNHRLDDGVAELVLKQGMPRLLDLYSKYDIKSTFFFTGHIAQLCPAVVKMAFDAGHEVASHGFSHDVKQAFDVLNPEEQKEHLLLSKNIIESIIGQKIVSFRAPAARVNKDIARALIETGFLVDSSISSQRLDMFMSFGTIQKMRWLFTPRQPYFTDASNIFRRGGSDLLEIPISALGVPYIGTFMRLAPGINRISRNLLHMETKLNNRPFVFLTHPNEFIDEEREVANIERRGSNWFSYYFGDLLRHRLKIRNLGEKALPILERELSFFKQRGYQFVSCSEYYELIKNNHAGK
jgi:peptidoglycan-N-acetylglucosamine deacetylase